MRRLALIALLAFSGCQGDPAASRGAGGRELQPLTNPCTWVGGAVTVSLAANEAATFALDGSNALTVNGTPCGSATLANTTRITVSTATPSAVTDETVIIDGTNGFFAPGTASGANIVIALGAGTGDSVQVIGGAGDDVLVTGRTTTDDWATFNHDAYRDLTLTGVELISLDGAGGNDTLTAAGRVPAWTLASQYTGLASTRVVTLTGGAGDDLLTGGDGDDVLFGGPGNDTLAGGLGNDAETGEAGNDTFDQGAATNGADVIIGGTETDTVSYAARTLSVTVTVGSAVNDGEANEHDDVRSDIEVVLGGAGNDTLSCNSALGCTLHGGAGNDTLTGRNGNDDLEGEAGDDLLQPGPGDDVVNGGAGVDTVTYADAASGVTVVLGTPGTPTLGNGTSGENDSLEQLENLIGSPFADTLTGNALDNRLTGGAGNDVLSGGAGDDTFDEGSAANGSDSFSGGQGEDRVDYSARSLPLTVTMDGVADDGQASEGDNVQLDVEDLSGGSAADSITGNAGDNKLDGNGGADTLSGLGGIDELTGGAGFDVLDGGDGDDILDQGADSAQCDCGPGFDIAICDNAPPNCEVR